MQYLGHVAEVYSNVSDNRLVSALIGEFGLEEIENVTAMQLHICLTHSKDPNDIVWTDCPEQDTLPDGGAAYYKTFWIEMVVPTAVINERLHIFLNKEETIQLDLSKGVEIVIELPDEYDFKCKILKSGKHLRNYLSGRKLHKVLIQDCKVVSVRYP